MNKILKDFKAFVMRGNILDMAIGVIIGGAFGKIVSSIVDDILMPIVGLVLGGQNFTSIGIHYKSAFIAVGAFIQNVIDFLIIAVCMFAVVTIVAKLTAKKKAEEEAAPPAKSEEVQLLEEIRDLLKK